MAIPARKFSLESWILKTTAERVILNPSFRPFSFELKKKKILK